MNITKEQKEINKINHMDHFEMSLLWRYAYFGHPYFDTKLPYKDIFEKRLFKHFGGITPEISKAINN